MKKNPYTVVTFTIKQLTHLICEIDVEPLNKVPMKGPLIIVSNHINFLDAPVVFTHLLPRPVTGFVKSENWNNLFLGSLFSLWEGIPIRRGEVDMTAMHQALDALDKGKILAIAPEGTRSGTGILQKGNPGMVTIALRSGAPVLPLVYYGNETYKDCLPHLRRTPFHIKTGRRFKVVACGDKVTHVVRNKMAEEVMYQIANLLPPAYRGSYNDPARATEQYLQFLD
jgi:1-acyl-sn-glycerol-3-phosphate acyltransferase